MRFLRYLKEHVFSRKSGLRHLAALALTFVVLVLTHLGMTLITGYDDWYVEMYRDAFRMQGALTMFGTMGVLIGGSALMGGFLRRCGEKWMARFFQKFFYSVLGLIPIVNLLVPLIYQRRRRKQGREQFVSDGTFRSSLEAETYDALVTNNIVLHPNGKLKFGIVRFVFAAFFRLLGGVMLLLFSLFVAAFAPGMVVVFFVLAALLSEYSPEALYWTGIAAAALAALIDVLHPMIALLVNPRRRKTAPAVQPVPKSAPEPGPEPEIEAPGAEPAPVENDDLPEPGPEPEPEPVAENAPDEEMAMALAGACEDDYPNNENGHGREIHNHKEILV